jgi:hypothetical protein
LLEPEATAILKFFAFCNSRDEFFVGGAGERESSLARAAAHEIGELIETPQAEFRAETGKLNLAGRFKHTRAGSRSRPL